MASMAQAVTTSVSPATNQRGADPAATAVAPVAALGSDTSRSQDTVNLTETGGRNVSIAGQNGKPQPAFQVTYFPPTVAQGAAAQPTAAVLAPANGPTTQGTNAALAAATASGPTNTAVAAATPQASLLSAASQAKLQQLDQVLQRLGINPTQISFAERIALLPLVNDPAAIQQYVQGLPTETAVLNPATSQVLAPAVTAQQNAPTASQAQATGSAAVSVGTTSGASGGANLASAESGSTAFNPGATSVSAAAAGAARSLDATGQKVNISV